MNKSLSWVVIVCGVFSVVTVNAAGQGAPQPMKIGSLTLSGNWRLRWENWNWFDTNAADGDYTFGASLLRIAIGEQKPKQDWQFEIAQPALIGLPKNAVAPAPQGQLGLGAAYFAANGGQDAGLFIKQAFVRFKGAGGDGANSLRLGRFEFIEGAETLPSNPTLAALKRERIAHRLIGNFAFSHVGRSLDGIHLARNTAAENWTFVAGRATEGVFQLDGMGELDVNVFYGALTKPFHFAGADDTPKAQAAEGRLFVLYYRDGRNELKTDNRSAAARAADTKDIRITTLGGHYLRAFEMGSGKGDLLIWGAWQTGDWGTQHHRAKAIAAEVGYQPRNDKLKPWMRAGYFRSSGDNEATDDDHKTFFQILPTPRIYARFPFYNLMNNEDAFLQILLRPHPLWSLRADVHRLRLSHEADLWYLGGGAFQDNSFGFAGRPSGGSKSLATLFDLSADYQLNAQTALTFYVARARGKGVMGSIYPSGKNALFFYVELTRKL
jgi:hypothetical protein